MRKQKLKVASLPGVFKREMIALDDSPICRKESMYLVLNTIASYTWSCKSIDIKSIFLLQNNNIDRNICLKPPRKANIDLNCGN